MPIWAEVSAESVKKEDLTILCIFFCTEQEVIKTDKRIVQPKINFLPATIIFIELNEPE